MRVVLDRDNKLVATLGDGQYSQDDWNKIRTQERETFVPGKIPLSAQRLLRPRREHFRGGMGRGRQGYETSQSWLEVAERNSKQELLLQRTCACS